ncbi:Glutamate formiminotransferase [Elusimicrobium minutum Pei191]|uniref:glutamate formimidoyltransferase n=1 Tax=Elusimicrobium minutum (strain Pei191) TaxID=445932 RepID=B2KCG2_ELUMP|nr:glutamate formimidoyltransferase [Elusimicrobium minutum]ACC98083.1 Glutamate formiminotransferase [Elusimicrobium minutum Pei191]
MAMIECVPNISEGKNEAVIYQITEAVKKHNVKILSVEPGEDANRTVITFAGLKENIGAAAYACIEKAYELIDMSKHKGRHPRQGVVDVCPFIPLSGATMQDCVDISKSTAKKVACNLGLPVYLYENSAADESRRNLAVIRKGGYETLEEKLKNLPPDFGPHEITPKVKKGGAITIGAREFLIAYNITLNTKSAKLAEILARKIRQSGGGRKLPGVKAIGWYLPAYEAAQVSCNITNFHKTSVHTVFETVKHEAGLMNIEVKGSELIGLIPKEALMQAGDFYSQTACGCEKFSESEKLQNAVKFLGLDLHADFDYSKKII